MMKWIGAILIVAGCGGVGFAMASAYRAEEGALEGICRALEYMRCELSYQMTPLPQLCRKTANLLTGRLKETFEQMALELERQVAPDAASCMRAVLVRVDLPESVQAVLNRMGTGLGCFDLPGQLRELEGCQQEAKNRRAYLAEHRHNRIRGYQTLGLCAGAALAILFL